jgi:hypothetical protein
VQLFPTRRAGSVGTLGGAFWMGATAAAVLAIAGCANYVMGPPAVVTKPAVDLGPVEAVSTPRVRFMTAQQYANVIADVFGSDIQIGTPIAPLMRAPDGLLSTTAGSVGIPGGQLMQLQRAATSIATQVVDKGDIDKALPAHRSYLVPCKPKVETAADDACAAKFIRATGRLLFRRPLAEGQVRDWVGKAHQGAEHLKDFYAGLASVLEGMLIDPMVLMVADTTEPDPTRPGQRRLDAYSMASRLSFFLWNSAPNDAVLKAAENGEIQTPAGRARVVEMMLASPRLENGVRAFFDDMLAYDKFDALAKDGMVYSRESGAVLKDAREQTLRTAYDHLIVRNRDYRSLFTTRDTFMSPALASVYNVPAVPGWAPYSFPEDSPRQGILNQVSFLALHSHPGRSSPTLRGKALRETLLCQVVPPPPPNVDFSAVEDPDANLHTARERLTAHRANPVCAGCHKITDPIGLAMENFDGAGQYRVSESGATIDGSGSLDGTTFNTPQGLAQALHDHPGLPTCFVKRLYGYGVGASMSEADKPQLTYLNKRFEASGYRVPDLLRAIALSPAFGSVAEPAAASMPAIKTTRVTTTGASAQ